VRSPPQFSLPGNFCVSLAAQSNKAGYLKTCFLDLDRDEIIKDADYGVSFRWNE